MFSNELDAYLSALSHLSRRIAAVVKTSYGVAEYFRASQNPLTRVAEQPIRAVDHVYGRIDDPLLEVVLIPRLHFGGNPGQVNLSTAIGHFTLGVHHLCSW